MKTHQIYLLAAQETTSHFCPEPKSWIFILVLLALGGSSFAQVTLAAQTPSASVTPTSGAPITITLQDALQRARLNDPQYRSAVTDLGLSREDRVQARAGLLPNINYNNSFIYTQGSGPLPASCANATASCPASRFIANNGVHEYISQGDVHQALSLTNFADYRRSSAALAQARAKAEIATRGLVVTVTQAYYGLVVAQRRYATAQRADAEAARFLDISVKLENGGEVAHADVIKARIQAQQQQRDLCCEECFAHMEFHTPVQAPLCRSLLMRSGDDAGRRRRGQATTRVLTNAGRRRAPAPSGVHCPPNLREPGGAVNVDQHHHRTDHYRGHHDPIKIDHVDPP